MRDVMILFAILTCCFLAIFGGVYYLDSKDQDKQHIKVQRVGCHQYRINEFTNEVQHLEGCNSVDHLNETK